MSTPYVPLHLHTEYSLLDGAIRINDLCKFSVENGFPAVAITDHGVMYGDMELYETAIMKYSGDNGSPKLKPLLGCEFYVHNGDIKERDKMNNPCYHLVLIAKNNVGYQNIIRLTSVAWCDGFYMHPRINWELLKEHHEGLICLSACLGGEVLQNLLHKDPEKAREVAKRYKDLFGDDYYIELQDHGLEDQKRTNPELIAIAKELGIEMVITNDSHYLKKEDADMHDTLLCMNTNSDKDDPNRFHFEGNEFYVKTPEQLRESFSWLDEETFNKCIANTVKIAEGCNIKISKFDELPAYDVPANHTTESYFEYLVIEGLKKRYGGISKELKERVDYEMKVIEDMGFTAYFLITWDFIHYAKTHGIPVGPGRGSAAGSVVAYALEITDLDPIEHKLLFERFLNPERFTMPDIDIDFCIERRGEVIDYVTKKYGEDRVCQIITFGTYAAKAAVKGVARILKIPFADSNRIASLIPSEPKTHIDDALQEGMELRVMYDNDEQIVIDPIEGKTVGVKKWIDLARGIEGIKNNTGTHAAGVIIAPKPLDQILPVRPSKDGIVQTGYPPHAVTEFLSLLKMDFLGLRNLTTIYKTLTAIKKRQGIDVDINHIPLDDKPTYQMLMAGDTDGVFQLESAGMKNLVKRLRPDVFEDLGALVALFRPGPLDSGMVDKFVDRKHGRVPITFPHPALEPVLKDTYGTIVYQEQIMQVFQILADYSLGQADMVRRMMGKKKIDEMQKQKGKFIEGAARHGMAAKDATALFEDIEKFAFFSKAALSAIPTLGFRPDIIHCHDWQTGLVPIYLDNFRYGNEFYRGIKTVMTIHNLKFQGTWDPKRVRDITGLPQYYFAPDKLEAYKDANYLKGGIVYADRVTTVSNSYAEEIKTPFYGEKLDGLMNARANCLSGIVNGIDYEDYNPLTDNKIERNYDVSNFRKEKIKNKIALQKELGLIAYVMDELCQDAVQIVALGTGEEQYENMFRHFAWKYPGKVSANIYYSEAMSHKIYASCDAFLMPSLFEPCGLSQLMSLRYGTVPIVRETGGLKDTVEPYNEYEKTGTGFSFMNYNAHEMLATVRYAEQIYYDKKRDWNKIVERAMNKDFSWKNSAKQYEELYEGM